MIGLLYAKIFRSDIGGRIFHINKDEDTGKIHWNEKGMRRFFFWNSIVWFSGMYSVFAYFRGFNFGYIIMILLISSLMTEKVGNTMKYVFEDWDKFEFESSDVRESKKYEILKDSVQTGDFEWEWT